jgi:hypothetical protein
MHRPDLLLANLEDMCVVDLDFVPHASACTTALAEETHVELCETLLRCLIEAENDHRGALPISSSLMLHGTSRRARYTCTMEAVLNTGRDAISSSPCCLDAALVGVNKATAISMSHSSAVGVGKPF